MSAKTIMVVGRIEPSEPTEPEVQEHAPSPAWDALARRAMQGDPLAAFALGTAAVEGVS